MHLMPLDKVTHRDGHWILRQGPIDPEGEIWVEVLSNRVPEGTLGRDLRPETLRITCDCEVDGMEISANALRELLDWPPAPSAPHGPSTTDDRKGPRR
jgi:hypothetical protein